eukprot:CAMPEP_0179489130 /NCGR_PEP_ID=MMETSP0799-20121207/64588_1 /TAXON_ID=46947 /ORGANISM="Geminigera cryophila, Strain CCMP2564" /LENGTH=133 /DNA_ID=CAMNT_0021304889 /DNA_START=15 /DNA_END=413 /DNA_ORIENTATION=-
MFDKVEIKTFGSVRGLAATTAIRKGDVLVSVPRKNLFSYTNTEKSLKKLWDATPDIRELDRLIITVMHEARRSTVSEFDYYLCGVPGPDSLGPPVLWDRDRLSRYCNQDKYEKFCGYVQKRTEYYVYTWNEVT